MFEKFQKHLRKSFPSIADKKLLLASSGGIDSMVLADLLKTAKLTFSIAHCNFNLREESAEDAKFIRDYANSNNIEIFVTSFDTVKFASDNKLSIQVAARQLRYMYFQQLATENNFDHILTAHHLDDNLETFLINFSRGTGLDGLTGIPESNGNILRLLLPFTRFEIEEYASQNHIQWREDSSNQSDKYVRNSVRHHIVPKLKELNSQLLSSFAQTLQNLQQSQSMAEDASILVYKQVVIEKETKIIFKIHELKKLKNYPAYLHHWLKDFGFTAWKDIYELPDSQSGKKIFSSDFVLFKDREILILERQVEPESGTYEIDRETPEISKPLQLTFEIVNAIDEPNENRIFVDADKMSYPLILRKWERGDRFYPIGMVGSKKISKYFKDEKISVSEKASIWILTSNEEIVWIVGYRADDRFKVTDETGTILKISNLS